MVAELVLAVATAVESCIKLGRKAVEAYRAYRDADGELENRIKVIEGLWVKLEVQLDFLSRISSQLDAKLATSQLDLLQTLHGKLASFTSQVEMPESSYLRKLKHAIVKKKLDELVTDIETWQRRFDPSWFIITLIGNSLIDTEAGKQLSLAHSTTNPIHNVLALRQAIREGSNQVPPESDINMSVNLDASGLVDAAFADVPFSSARIVTRKHAPRTLIAEIIETSESDVLNTKRLAENLARRLKHVDSDSFRLLRCYGLLKHRDSTTGKIASMEMMYLAPSIHGSPSSLRKLLLDQGSVSVSLVVKIARQLVQSVSYVHACDFVHKNIRPDIILVFPDGSSYLAGFNRFRDTCFQTNLKGDPRWHLNLYRHPQRQGSLFENRYIMQHDIYSLGVCLLEIGLWKSFVWYPRDNAQATPVPGLALGFTMSDDNFTSVGSIMTLQTKERLVRLAEKQLPPRLGDIYTELVIACLTCLDPGNRAFGGIENMEDEDGIQIGVRYVEKILHRMADISV